MNEIDCSCMAWSSRMALSSSLAMHETKIWTHFSTTTSSNSAACSSSESWVFCAHSLDSPPSLVSTLVINVEFQQSNEFVIAPSSYSICNVHCVDYLFIAIHLRFDMCTLIISKYLTSPPLSDFLFLEDGDAVTACIFTCITACWCCSFRGHTACIVRINRRKAFHGLILHKCCHSVSFIHSSNFRWHWVWDIFDSSSGIVILMVAYLL